MIVHSIFACLRMSLSATKKKHGQRMMSVRPNRLLSQVLSTVGQCSVSFQPVLLRQHTQTRIVHFLGERISIPNSELVLNRVPIELF